MAFIYKFEGFKHFRKSFTPNRLTKKCNIFEVEMKKDEIMFLSVRQSDNHSSHSICICNGYIFDSNTTNALPFTKEGINNCCGEDTYFQGIDFGYLYMSFR